MYGKCWRPLRCNRERNWRPRREPLRNRRTLIVACYITTEFGQFIWLLILRSKFQIYQVLLGNSINQMDKGILLFNNEKYYFCDAQKRIGGTSQLKRNRCRLIQTTMDGKRCYLAYLNMHFILEKATISVKRQGYLCISDGINASICRWEQIKIPGGTCFQVSIAYRKT